MKYQVSTCANCGCENVRAPGDIQECWFCGDAYLDQSLTVCSLTRDLTSVNDKRRKKPLWSEG